MMVMTAEAISCAKLHSNHHHQQTNIHFLQAGCPSCHPTNSVKALKGKLLQHYLTYNQNSDRVLVKLCIVYNSMTCVIKINISKTCMFQLCVLSKSLSIFKIRTTETDTSFSQLRTQYITPAVRWQCQRCDFAKMERVDSTGILSVVFDHIVQVSDWCIRYRSHFAHSVFLKSDEEFHYCLTLVKLLYKLEKETCADTHTLIQKIRYVSHSHIEME